MVEESEATAIADALVKTETEGFSETDGGAAKSGYVLVKSTGNTTSGGQDGNTGCGGSTGSCRSANIPDLPDLLGSLERSEDPITALIDEAKNGLPIEGPVESPELPQDTSGASTKSDDTGSFVTSNSYSYSIQSSSNNQENAEDMTKFCDVRNLIYREQNGLSFPTPEASPEKNAAKNLDTQKTLPLRGYQKEVAKALLRGENDIVILPTGTGKTRVAIEVIDHHIKQRKDSLMEGQSDQKCKIVFLVPTATLAKQQLEKIQEIVKEKCIRITGENHTPLEKVKGLVKDNVHKVLVVTPAIINNYFNEFKEEATITDFTLLIFDECHHAKEGHPYNLLLRRYYEASRRVSSDPSVKLPQLMGMTASLGIGGTKNEADAEDFMLKMCARFHLKNPPTPVRENSQELLRTANIPKEEVIYITSQEKDKFTEHLEKEIMSNLENLVCEKVKGLCSNPEASSLKPLKFPTDRHHQSYEQYVTEMKKAMSNYLVHDAIQSDVNFINLALRQLEEYYRCLELVSLLQCKHGVEYLENMLQMPEYQGIDVIIDLLKGNMEKLRSLQAEVDGKSGNPKLVHLQETLKELFTNNLGSKVIIFVRMRVLTKFMAEWLCSLDAKNYRAKEFTSSGPPTRAGGMKPSCLADAREGFEGERYNILVSTSVLEEGIDVQACNMVIRYMYSKDMIGKIQARGRARHKGGQIVTLADTKLSQQEEKNTFKEGLMHKALDTIQNMEEKRFLSYVNNLRMYPMLLFQTKMESTKKPSLSTGIIKCSLCGSDLGNTRDIKRFLQSHYLVLDSSISQKVISVPKKSTMEPMNGVIPHSLLVCSAGKENGKICNNPVGTLITIRHMGYYFGMWNIEEIQVDKRKFKKYQDLKEVYEIKDISIKDLLGLAPGKQFPPDLLRE